MAISEIWKRIVVLKYYQNWNKCSVVFAYSEPFKTSKMDLFGKTFDGLQALNDFIKSYILDVLQSYD